MTRPAPRAPLCTTDPACGAWGIYGFSDPSSKDRRSLWACRAHREEAEERWRTATGNVESGRSRRPPPVKRNRSSEEQSCLNL